MLRSKWCTVLYCTEIKQGLTLTSDWDESAGVMVGRMSANVSKLGTEITVGCEWFFFFFFFCENTLLVETDREVFVSTVQ